MARVPRRARNANDRLGGSDCEAIRDGAIAQPVNTLTSLTYVLVAAWAAPRVRQLRPGQRGAAAGFAALLALVGLGSVDYHGPQWPGAKARHDYPIGLLLACVGGILLQRRRWREPLLPGLSPRLALGSAGVWLAAPVAFSAGRTGSPTCRPDSLLQLHGLWHALSAAGFGLSFLILFPAPED